MRAHLFAEVVLVPRGSAPPELNGRGAQQVLDAAADGSGSVGGHRAVSRRLAASLLAAAAHSETLRGPDDQP